MATGVPRLIGRVAIGVVILGIIFVIGIQKGAFQELPEETVVVTSEVLTGSTAKSSRWYVQRVRLQGEQEVSMTFGQVLRVGQRVRVTYSRNIWTDRIRVHFYKVIDDAPAASSEVR